MFEKIAIVGLGLMGGSKQAACKKYKVARHILGFDLDLSQSDFAIANNIIDEVYKFDQASKVDLIVICASLSGYEKSFKLLSQLCKIKL